MVGYEGIFALAGLTIVIGILNYVPCSFGIDACAYGIDGKPFVEQTRTYFTSIGSTNLLLSFGILGVLSITVFNVCSVCVTKYINALTRSICGVTRTILIWFIGIIVTITLGKTQRNYRWESLALKQIVMESLGFLTLIIGNLLYNRIIKFDCFLSQNDFDTFLVLKQ